MTAPMLALARYRFTTRTDAPLALPPYAGALLRSVFGAALRAGNCATRRETCPGCPLLHGCAYPAIFETPPRPTQFEQRFSQVPNPYVIEPPSTVGTGRDLVFHMVLVGEPTLRRLPLIVQAWQRALRLGLGPARTAGHLVAVEHVAADGATSPAFDLAAGRALAHPGWTWPALPDAQTGTVELRLDTPLRLQHQGQPLRAAALNPRVLASHLLRRINLMLDLHLDLRPAPFDAPALVAQAAGLQDDRSGLHWQDWTRWSSRQRQEMTLGGVVGSWRLSGDVAALLPWLVLGQWLHVGKNATMGLGGYRVVVGSPAAT